MTTRYGRVPKYGPRNPCKVHWPADHRELYERDAVKLGLTLGEYLIRLVARVHGLPVPEEEEGSQLSLTA